MESVYYAVESDASKAIASNNKLKSSLESVQSVTVNTMSRMDKFTDRVEGAGLGAVRASGGFKQLDKAAGGLGGSLLGVTDTLDMLGDRSNVLSTSVGSATKSMGALGSAALIASAAFIGWDIGRKISEITGLDKVMTDFYSKFPGFIQKTEELLVKMHLLEGGTGSTQDAVNRTGDAMQGLAMKLQAAGKSVDFARLNDVAYQNELLKTANTVHKSTEAYQNFAAANTKLTKEQKDAAAAAKKYASEAEAQIKAQNQLVHSFMDQLNPLNALQDKYEQLAKSGITLDQFTRAYSKQIVDAAEAQIKMGQAIHPTTQKIYEQAKAIEAAKNQTADWGKEMGLITQGSAKWLETFPENLAPADDGVQNFTYDMAQLNEMFEGGIDKSSEYASTLSDVADTLFMASEASGGLATTTGKVFDLFGNVGSKAADLVKNHVDLLSKEGVTGLMDAVGQSVAQWGEWGQIASIAIKGVSKLIQGDLIGGLIAVGSAAFLALKKLFGRDWEKDATRAVSDFTNGLQVSEETIKRIADQLKSGEFKSTLAAVSMNLSEMADELGVTTENLGNFEEGWQNLIIAFSQGELTIEQAAGELNELFPKMLEAATDAFGFIDEKMSWLIQQTKDHGIEVAAITQFLDDQINKAKEDLKALGLDTEGAFNEFFALDKIMEKFPDQVAVFQHVAGAVVGLSNAGELTANRFDILQKRFTAATKHMLDGNAATKNQLISMLPTLQTLMAAHDKYGFTLGRNVEKLIEQARQLGLLPKDPAEEQQQSFERLTDSVEELNKTLKNLPKQIQINVVTNYTSTGTPPPESGGDTVTDTGPDRFIPRFATLEEPITFSKTQKIIVDEGETLLPRGGGGKTVNIQNINFYGVQNIQDFSRQMKQVLYDNLI